MSFTSGIKLFIVLFLLCYYNSTLFSQCLSSSDSLKNLYRSAKQDSVRIKYLCELAASFGEISPDSSEYYLNEALKVADNGTDVNLKITAYNNLGLFYSNTGNYKKAIDYFQASLKIAEKRNDKQALAYCYMYIGELYMYQGSYAKSLELLQKAFRIFEDLDKTKDIFLVKKGIEICCNNIGTVHAENGNYDQANDYFKKALAIEEKLGDSIVIAGCQNNIGNVYYMQGDYPMAVEYYIKSLKIAEEMQDKSSMSERYNNLGVVYTEMGKYKEAIDYYEKSLGIDTEVGDQKGMSIVLGNIALLRIYLKQYDKAIKDAEQSLEIAKKIGSLDEQKCACEYLATAYDSLKNYKKTCKYLKLFKQLTDSIFNIESGRQVKEMEAVYQNEKKQKEIELLNKNKELQEIEISKQEMQKFGLVIGLGLMLVLSIAVYRNYRNKKKANVLLTAQKKEIEEKNEELKQSNEEISAQRDEIESQRDIVTFQKEKIEEIHGQLTSSIHYAKRIQNAIMPNKESVDAILNDYFILMRPRDIVSGDFFWLSQRKNYLLIAVADCTGHGVPGAFISMLGIAFLNDIVAREDVTKANHVLNALREYVLKSLRQKGVAGEKDLASAALSAVNDGMDIAFFCLDTNPVYNESGVEYFNAQFAGANNSLYMVTGCSSLVTGEVN